MIHKHSVRGLLFKNWQHKFSTYQYAVVIVVFGVTGAWMLATSHATTTPVSVQAENGTVTPPAVKVTGDSTASGGSAVQFNMASTGGGGSTRNCPAYPAFPDANCTGVPAGTTLTAYTGSDTISTAGTVINAKNITSCLTITAANVTITNSLIKAACDQGYLVQTSGAGSVTISDTEFDGLKDSGKETGLYGNNFSCTRCKVHNVGEGFHMEDGDTIVDSFVYDLFGGDSSHNNAIITNGSGNDTITHNNLCAVYSGTSTLSGGFCGGTLTTYGDYSTGTTGISSSLSLFGDFGVVHDILIQQNLISTNVGGYCTYGGSVPSKPDPHANHVRYLNNQFSTKFNPNCGGFGLDADYDDSEPGNQWLGNTWADGPKAGQTINP